MILYIVPLPIGNLKDITLRAIEVLKEVDFIVAEDTRYSLKLLNHFGIKKRIISYYKHREFEKSGLILRLLRSQNAALITDSGTPLISDPGFILVKKAIERGMKIIALPGPTAFVPALVTSGINPEKFLFFGFPPRKKNELTKFLNNIVFIKHTLVFYESPRRVEKFLNTAFLVFGNRKFAVIKELSKKNEKTIRGEFNDLKDILKSEIILGEIVIVIEGCDKNIRKKESPEIDSIEDIFNYFKENHNLSKNRIKKALMKR